jgi:hypothetical protein
MLPGTADESDLGRLVLPQEVCKWKQREPHSNFEGRGYVLHIAWRIVPIIITGGEPCPRMAIPPTFDET